MNKRHGYCELHSREMTGFTTLFCPDCVREQETQVRKDELMIGTTTVAELLARRGVIPPVSGNRIWDVCGTIDSIAYPPGVGYIVFIHTPTAGYFRKARVVINRVIQDLESGPSSITGKTFACNASPLPTMGPYTNWLVGDKDAILIT